LGPNFSHDIHHVVLRSFLFTAVTIMVCVEARWSANLRHFAEVVLVVGVIEALLKTGTHSVFEYPLIDRWAVEANRTFFIACWSAFEIIAVNSIWYTLR